MSTQEAFQKKYAEAVLREAAEREKFFREQKPGWFNGAFWDMQGDRFVIVETADSDNSLYYPD